MIAPTTFADYVFEALWKRYPDWDIERAYALDSGGVADFFLSRGEERIVVMLSERGNLIYDHVDRAVEWSHETGARETVIYTSLASRVDDLIAEYAKRNNVRIERADFTPQ